MKIYLFLLLFPLIIYSQVTLKITGIPSNTPPNATLYFVGSANNWSLADANYALKPDGLGNFKVTIPKGTGTVSYKFNRGSWATVEGNATGSFLTNRSFTFTNSPQTINLTILSWEDLGSGSKSTAASNVQILNNSFEIPQLNRTRKIWLYLPPDYLTSTKTYPVLYMQDGQNLFDSNTSFSGEWQVDETLNSLFEKGDYGAIVVGIDNGGGERLNEYSPWVNLDYGGGDGDAYMDFMANTLKPYIDENYRTRPEPSMNALIGSSMGAIISTYGACEYPNAFQKVGSFSPAYWFALSNFNNYINANNLALQNHRMYFVAGTNESLTMVSNVNSVRDNLIKNNLMKESAFSKFDTYGTHSESYWKGEFAAAYKWLFQNEKLSTNNVSAVSSSIIQTLSGKLYAEGLVDATEFQIVNSIGQVQQNLILTNGVYQMPENLAKGFYILKSVKNVFKPIKIYKN